MHSNTTSVTPANDHHPPNQTKASTIGIAIAAVSQRWPTDCPCLLAFPGRSGCGFCSVACCTRLILPVQQWWKEQGYDQNGVVVDNSFLRLHVNLLARNQATVSVSHSIHYRPIATAGSY